MKSVMSIFKKSVQKIQISLYRTRLTGTLHENQCTFFLSYHAQLFLERKMFQAEVVEKIKTNFMFNTPPPKIVLFMR